MSDQIHTELLYPYSSLPEDQLNTKLYIRLLRLLPHVDRHAPIKCQLFNYPLHRSFRSHLYEALSYCWGNSDPKTLKQVYVDDTYLNVTPNLHAALLHLRDPFLERILWIDAICINQNDLVERAKQVRIMAHIYACASRVVVWLGEEADASAMAFAEIHAAASKAVEQGDGIHTESITEKGSLESRLVEQPGTKTSNKSASDDFNAVSKLFARPWFRRIWVLQEVAAARRILITCGDQEVNEHIFCLGSASVQYIHDMLSSHEMCGSRPVMHLIKSALNRPSSAIGLSNSTSLDNSTLSQLIGMFHTHEASDPRDKVYALLGMASNRSSLDRLSPDYTITWETLFCRLIHTFLGDEIEIQTREDKIIAGIKGKGCVLGRVDEIEDQPRTGRHTLTVVSKHFRGYQHTKLFWRVSWTPQILVHAVQAGDLLCLLQGAKAPCIIRPCGEHFALIMVDVDLPPDIELYDCDSDLSFRANTWISSTQNPRANAWKGLDWSHILRLTTTFRQDLRLMWNWENLKYEEAYCQIGYSSLFPTETSDVRLDRALLLERAARVLEECEDYEKANEIMSQAIKVLNSFSEGDHYQYRERMLRRHAIYQWPDAWSRIQYSVHKVFGGKIGADNMTLKESLTKGTTISHLYPDSLELMHYVKQNYESIDLRAVTGRRFRGTLTLLCMILDDNIPLTKEILHTMVQDHGGIRELKRMLIEKPSLQITYKHLRAAVAADGPEWKLIRLFLEARTDSVRKLIKETDIGLAMGIKFYEERLPDILANECPDIDVNQLEEDVKVYMQAFDQVESSIRHLISRNIDLDIPNCNDITLLNMACRYGNAMIVKLLLDTGRVNVNYVNHYGKTPLDYADESQSHGSDIRSLLLQHGARTELSRTNAMSSSSDSSYSLETD